MGWTLIAIRTTRRLRSPDESDHCNATGFVRESPRRIFWKVKRQVQPECTRSRRDDAAQRSRSRERRTAAHCLRCALAPGASFERLNNSFQARKSTAPSLRTHEQREGWRTPNFENASSGCCGNPRHPPSHQSATSRVITSTNSKCSVTSSKWSCKSTCGMQRVCAGGPPSRTTQSIAARFYGCPILRALGSCEGWGFRRPPSTTTANSTHLFCALPSSVFLRIFSGWAMC
jgi:hypothetical protein